MVPAAILFHVFYTFNLKTLQTRTHLARCSRTQKKEWRINKRTPELNFAQKPTLVVSSVMTKVADAGRHRKLNVKLCCSICSQCAPSAMISIFTTGCSWWTLVWTTTTRHGLLSKSECEWLSEKAGRSGMFTSKELTTSCFSASRAIRLRWEIWRHRTLPFLGREILVIWGCFPCLNVVIHSFLVPR